MASPVVLVVDDDFLIRTDISLALQEGGFTVLEAHSAERALEILRSDRSIEVVCTDVQMPGQFDGIDLALVIQEQRPETNVVVISAISRSQDRLPSVPFLSKPFVSSRLVDLVREQLGGLQSNRPNEARTTD